MREELLPLSCALTGDQTHNPAMGSDQGHESNQGPFAFGMMPIQLSHTGQGKSVFSFVTPEAFSFLLSDCLDDET